MISFVYNDPSLKNLRRGLRKRPTDVETKLWNILRGNSLGVKFRRQYGIGNHIVDFCCPAKRLVIELDGSQHYEDEGLENDKTRDRYLSELGYTVLRFSNKDVIESIDGVVMKIEEYL